MVKTWQEYLYGDGEALPLGDVTPLVCPYCDGEAVVVRRNYIEPRGRGHVWYCEPCDARVGIHKRSKRFAPKGTLAKKPLRRLRQRVHNLFDRTWHHQDDAKGARITAYQWLAEIMEMDVGNCHIGMFDEAACEEAITKLSGRVHVVQGRTVVEYEPHR